MTEIDRIRDQLRRSIEGGAWHGDSVLEILNGVSAEQAAARPISEAHTIWELLIHITNWADEITRRLAGTAEGDPPDEYDWPPQPANPTEEAWRQELDRLKSVSAEVDRLLAGFDASKLDDKLMDHYSSAYQTAQGVVQHHLYHAGQMALLKKLL